MSLINTNGLLINGEWTNGSEGNTLTAHNPANGEALATFIDATDADVDAAVNAAKEAFKTWKIPAQRNELQF